MIKKLHKGNEITSISVEPKEGERTLLCSNKGDQRSPFLGFNPNNPLVSKEMAMDYLAEILVEIFLDQERKKYAKQTRSDLLPGINKRTS
jgi:hypothetical protein